MSLLSTAVAKPPSASVPEPGSYERFVQGNSESVQVFYDNLGERRLTWNRRFSYYRQKLKRFIRYLVPPGARVLDIGCGAGDVISAVEPREGVGVDCSQAMVDLSRREHPGLRFTRGFAESLDQTDIPDGPYDYITLINVIGEMADIGEAFRQVHRYCASHTRVIIVQYNYLWEPICRLAGRLGLKLNAPIPNWLAPRDLEGLLHLCGYEVVRQGHTMPLPIRIPGLNWLFSSSLGRLLVPRSLGFLSYIVARPIVPFESPHQHVCSVVVPCKNEEDNIADLVQRIPEMGAGTEIIFVDDQSIDRTAALVQEAITKHPDRDIRLVSGPGQGKGAACRAGFAKATGDVFMILDADMTVMPEELPAFFEAITHGKGEFINGSRMVYPLEDQAMRPLNILGNKMFAGLFSLLLKQRIRDTLCGTKVVWARDYPKLLASREYFGSCDVWGDYDWIFGAAKNNLKIVELPVHYRERIAGVTKMNRRFHNAWIMLKMCSIAFHKLCY